ncbi:MAG: thiolase family protein [Candidatus Firestonebacteria bacterium]
MERLAIVDGVRTPFVKAGTILKDIPAYELGKIVVQELLAKTEFAPAQVDEVIFGNVIQPVEAVNISRVISLFSGIPQDKIASTVHRNCASGMEAVTTAYEKILSGRCEIVIAGGTESMSNTPLLFDKKFAELLLEFKKSKSIVAKVQTLLKFRPKHFKPKLSLVLGLTDIVCGLNMGQTAEILAKEFGITRQEQDEFSLSSYQKAVQGRTKLKEEIVSVYLSPEYKTYIDCDNGPRENQTLEGLGKLRPYFDYRTGTVTVGNSCQVTDGAVALLVMKESKAKELGFTPLGYLKYYSYIGLDPMRMGLGPAYAIQDVLKKSGLNLKDIQLIEINEAFASQVIACERLLISNGVGQINPELLNVNGGAIALGHPVGATGARLILTILKEMKRRDLKTGLVSLCIGGGQGTALILER